MGTRGFITFVVDGEEKTSYQQFDSYPDGVGLTVLRFLRNDVCANPTNVHRLVNAARALRVVTEADEVTPADVEALKLWTNGNVSKRLEPGELPDWYQLTRESQGNPGEILRCGVLLDAAEFPRDSLFAEWGYVIDLDEHDLEVYVGFQTKPHNVGRFADREPLNGEPDYEHRTTVYYPVKRIAAWPLDELPTDDEFIAATTRGED